MGYSALAINNKGKMRALAVAMEKRHPLLPDTPTSKELVWTGSTALSAESACRNRLHRLRASACPTCGRALNSDPEMKELAARSGFELVNVGVDQMDTFMKERIKVYTEVAKRMGLAK